MSNYDIVLLIGQSNNKGRATRTVDDEDYSAIPNTYQFSFQTQSIKAATHPLEHGAALSTSMGKWKIFAENYEANNLEAGRSLLFVCASFGGSGFQNGVGTLYPNNSNYELAKDTINAAIATGSGNRIVLISFWHGEKDSIEGSTTYYTDLSYYWQQMKADIPELNDNIPFSLLQPAARTESGYTNVTDGLKKFASENKNRVYIDLSGQPIDGSNHYERDGVLFADQREYNFYEWVSTMAGNATVKHKSIIGFNDGAFDASGNVIVGQASLFVGFNYEGALSSYGLDLVLVNPDGATEDLCIVGFGDRDLKNDVPYIVIDTDRSALIANDDINDWPDSISLSFKVDGATTRTLSAADLQAANKNQLSNPLIRPNFVVFQLDAGTELGCITAMITNGEGGTVTTTDAGGTLLLDSASSWVDDQHNGKAAYNLTTGSVSLVLDTVDSTGTLSLTEPVLGTTIAHTVGDVYAVGSLIEIEAVWEGGAGGTGEQSIISHNIIKH